MERSKNSSPNTLSLSLIHICVVLTGFDVENIVRTAIRLKKLSLADERLLIKPKEMSKDVYKRQSRNCSRIQGNSWKENSYKEWDDKEQYATQFCPASV